MEKLKSGDVLFVRTGSREYCTLLEVGLQKQWVSCSIQRSPAETIRIVPITFFEYGQYNQRDIWFIESDLMNQAKAFVLDANICHSCKHRLSKVVSNCCAARFEPIEG